MRHGKEHRVDAARRAVRQKETPLRAQTRGDVVFRKADDAGGILQVIRKIQFRDIQPRALKQAGKAGVSLVPRHVKAMRELAGVFLQYR